MAKNIDYGYRDVGDSELFDMLDKAKKELFNLRFQHVTGQLEQHAQIHRAKRQVARIMTEIRSREIAAAEALVAAEEAS
jgi:large subunit ribosomal protein L29